MYIYIKALGRLLPLISTLEHTEMSFLYQGNGQLATASAEENSVEFRHCRKEVFECIE